MDTVSGGEARRIALARCPGPAIPRSCWTSRPTISTSRAIERLETDLQDFRGALVMISHDRRFLTALSRHLVAGPRQGAGAGAGLRGVRGLVGDRARRRGRPSCIGSPKAIRRTDWLHFGVTARRKRNQGRLRRLQAMHAGSRGAPSALKAR
ncbi:MAG: hypothetical protein R3F54_25635 [Alphaproteobacteria bacterium]